MFTQRCMSFVLLLLAGACSNPMSDQSAGQDPATGGNGVVGCASGVGFAVGPLGRSIFACPGRFGLPDTPVASAICSSTYAPCGTMPTDTSLCNALGGFFAINVQASREPAETPLQAACVPPSGDRLALWAGCGALRSSVFPATGDTATGCAENGRLLDCATDQSWGCATSTDLETTTNSDPSDGILCCEL
jgi:hypothetical protein